MSRKSSDKFAVSNHAPTVASVAITPDLASTTSDLLATPSGWYDADGDPEGYDWLWEKDSSGEKFAINNYVVIAGANTDTLASANFVKGDVVRVTCTPNDGEDAGSPVTSEVTIGNAAPTAATATITPTSPGADANVRCAGSGSTDADGDSVSYSYQWYKDGVLQPACVWPGVCEDRTSSGDVWRCVVTPSDGTEDGPSGEASATIVNTPPTQPTVTITPSNPGTNDGFRAEGSGSVDADGDTVSYSYQWYKDGVLQTSCVWPGVCVQRTSFGEVWRCVVTPNDGTDDGSSGEASVTIANTAPTAPAVVISTDVACMRATASGSTDADGDPVTYSYQWYKDGVLRPNRTWPAVRVWRTSPGEQWRCVVTPNDGFADGPTGEATVTIAAAKSTAPLSVMGLAALPTARGAEVAFTLSTDAAVTCEVLNIAGRAVKTIVSDRPMAAGINSLAWDGRNAAGLRVPGGMYMVRMTATGATGARWNSMSTLSLTR